VITRSPGLHREALSTMRRKPPAFWHATMVRPSPPFEPALDIAVVAASAASATRPAVMVRACTHPPFGR
jgi:hypothetical protein